MNFKKYHVSKNLFDIASWIIDNGSTYTKDGESYTFATKQSMYSSPYYFSETDIAVSISGMLENISTTAARIDLLHADGTVSSGNTITDTKVKSENIYAAGLRFNWSTGGTVNLSNIMLNTGSTALPYEPYSSEVWHDTPYYIRKTDTDTLTLPAVIYGDGTNATLTIKGNTVQSGTPSLQNPVTPNGTGDRTANLAAGTFNINKTVNDVNVVSDIGGYFTVTGQASSGGGRTNKISDNITLPSGSYRVSIGGTINCQLCVNNASNNAFITGFYSGGSFSTSSETTIYFGLNFTAGTIYNDSFYIMLQPFASDYPYEPYGYKIPILNGSQTTPVYLGEVETERKIKKLVLDGTENWILSNTNTFRITINDYKRVVEKILISSHYPTITNVTDTGLIPNETCMTFLVSSSGNNYFYIRDLNQSNANALKAYLAAQYAAGTPVTVWYVLATPETAVVNEPLMKIGDYADSLTTSIPTTDGANALSVDTTVQPSEVTANYHGWHPVQSVHERESGQWT